MSRQKRALALAGIGTWHFDATTRSIHLSEACQTLLFVSTAELSPESFVNCLFQGDTARVELLLASIHNGEAFEFESPLTSPDGAEHRIIELKGTPLFDEDGMLVGYEGITHDTTERVARISRLRQLAMVAERTQHGVMVSNAQIQIEWINAGFTTLTGYTLDDVRGKFPSYLAGAQTNPQTLARMGMALRAREPFNDEILQYTKDGRAQWVRIDVQPVRDDRGNVTHMVAIESDVTESKRLEHEQAEVRLTLERTLSTLRTVMDSTEHMVVAVDSHGQCTLFNHGGESITGYSADEMLGHKIAAVLHDPSEFVTYAAELAAEGIEVAPDVRVLTARLDFAGAPSDTREWTFIRKDGQRRTVLITLTALSGPDNSTGYIGVVIDITERKAAEAKWREEVARLMKLSRHLPGAMFQYRMRRDETPTMPWASEVIADVLDLTPEEVRDDGQRLIDAVYFEDRAQVVADLKRSARQLSRYHAEFRIQKKNGELRWVQCNATPEREDDGGVLWHGFVSDITERKRFEDELVGAREAALGASRVKSEFLANMSHEIRTPLNGILGMTQLVLDSQLSTQQRSFLEAVNTSGNTLLSVINDILDLSKVEAGRLELERVSFSLRELLGRVVETVTLRAEEKALAVRLVVDERLPQRVWGDPTRVFQVLVNLAGNAVKFTGSGEVRLEVTARAGDEVRFEVTDTGIGIAADVLPRLFKAFSQGDGSITRRYGGTGLGLAISRKLAERMGGTLEVTSIEGHGSTFSMVLPLEAAEALKPVAVEQEVGAATRVLEVLVAEDNAINALVVRTLLEREGHRVVHVTTGASAVAAWSEKKFDLVLMDMQMPELDGLEATRRIRQREQGGGTHVHICALTANAMKGDVDRCHEAGMDDYLAKPIDLKALRRKLAAL